MTSIVHPVDGSLALPGITQSTETPICELSHTDDEPTAEAPEWRSPPIEDDICRGRVRGMISCAGVAPYDREVNVHDGLRHVTLKSVPGQCECPGLSLWRDAVRTVQRKCHSAAQRPGGASYTATMYRGSRSNSALYCLASPGLRKYLVGIVQVQDIRGTQRIRLRGPFSGSCTFGWEFSRTWSGVMVMKRSSESIHAKAWTYLST